MTNKSSSSNETFTLWEIAIIVTINLQQDISSNSVYNNTRRRPILLISRMITLLHLLQFNTT